jgi:hypothetical protein
VNIQTVSSRIRLKRLMLFSIRRFGPQVPVRHVQPQGIATGILERLLRRTNVRTSMVYSHGPLFSSSARPTSAGGSRSATHVVPQLETALRSEQLRRRKLWVGRKLEDKG